MTKLCPHIIALVAFISHLHMLKMPKKKKYLNVGWIKEKLNPLKHYIIFL